MEENQRFEADIDVSQEEIEASKKKNKKMKKEGLAYELFDLFRTFVVCAILVFLFTRFIMAPVQVDGLSMYPTLKDNQIGLMNIVDKSIHGIQRFDVVVAKSDRITGGDDWVKRVIGLPGDTVYAKDDVVYVNGMAIEEPYLETKYVKDIRSRGDIFTQDFEKIKLGSDEYWLMGDNRSVSHDSRAVGPFKKANFVGKDVYVVYPFSEIGLVRNGNE